MKHLSRGSEAGGGVLERARDGGVSDTAGYQVKYEFFLIANDLVSILKRLEAAQRSCFPII